MEDGAVSGPESQTKHRNLQWTIVSSENTDMLGKGEVHIHIVHWISQVASVMWLPQNTLYLLAEPRFCALSIHRIAWDYM